MKIYITVICMFLLGCGLSPEGGTWRPKYHEGRGPNGDEAKSVFIWLIESESSGEDPIGRSWNEYWNDRFIYLRKNKSPEEADSMINFIKNERNNRGLEPVE
jgi:hypothetical protein